MGLFSSKKIYVASTVQNMAGDELERPNYLKTTVVGSVLAGRESIADTLQRAYLKGPGIKLRSFFRWARNHYTKIGMPTARTGNLDEISPYAVSIHIPVDADEKAFPQTVEAGIADYMYWAEQYMVENHFDDLESDWSADYNDDTGQITITFADDSIYTFTPSDFEKDSQYLYVSYSTLILGATGPKTIGEIITTGSGARPEGIGTWQRTEYSGSENPVTLNRTTTITVSYSDGRPSETTTVSAPFQSTYEVYDERYERDITTGSSPVNPNKRALRHEWLHLVRNYDHIAYKDPETTSVDEPIEGGVTKTTTTTIQEESVRFNGTFQLDYQYTVIEDDAGPFVYIYRQGSGKPDLDALFPLAPSSGPEYFPFIPIRLDNKFVDETFTEEQFKLVKKAFNKAVDGKIEKVIDELAEAENLNDMDHIYAVFGVSANVLDNSCRKYLYEYFVTLMNSQSGNMAKYDNWAGTMASYQGAMNNWLVWAAAQDDPEDPLYDTEPPPVMTFPNMPETKIRIQSHGEISPDYDIEISWQWITEQTGTGLAKPGAKKNEVWFEPLSQIDFNGNLIRKKDAYPVLNKAVNLIRLYWQLDENNWKSLDIMGMTHRNYIYKGKYVEISLREALADTEESGFIVPLHYPTYTSMSLVDSTQMSTACAFLVFNSYVVKKTGLLGSLFFKIFLIVVIIAIVVFVPQLAPGVVKAAGATGAALGFSGTTALIIGAAVNAIAAMVISSLIMKAFVGVFGEKWGTILGTIAVLVAANVGGNLIGGKGFTVNFGNILSAQNLMTLANSVGNVYSKLMYLSAMDTLQKTQDLIEDFEQKMEKVTQAYAENFGYDNGVIDPMQFTDAGDIAFEPADTFLIRTLLTGSDIAEMSMNMLSEFPALTLNVDPDGL